MSQLMKRIGNPSARFGLTNICRMVHCTAKVVLVIKKSFLVTGQSKNSRPSDISCLKEGRECHDALKRVEEMWDKPLKELGKVDNPTETDETEDEKNELVILDDADN